LSYDEPRRLRASAAVHDHRETPSAIPLKPASTIAEIRNTINQFSSRLYLLALWEEVIGGYCEEQALELRLEFTELLVYYCLHEPYEFPSRVIFAAIQLCYTRGLERRLIEKIDVDRDRDINYRSLDKVAKHWQDGRRLLESVQALNRATFREGTNNYRHRTQHRIRPGIDFGYTNIIERSFPPDARVAYTFGEAAPLATANLIPMLTDELRLMIAAFEVYRTLVDEHR
jgi:hypothetical protein